MKKHLNAILTTAPLVVSLVLNVLAILAFSSWDNSTLGGTLLSLGSACLCFGIFLSRKDRKDEEK